MVSTSSLTAALRINPEIESLGSDGRPALPSFVETVAWAFPDTPVYTHGETYADLIFEDHTKVINEHELNAYRLNYAKYLYIERSFEQANGVQEAATGYHTISKTTTMIQTDVYRMKHEEAVKYAIRCEQILSIKGDYSVVPVPKLLKNESDAVGQDPYHLALSIIQNFNASNDSLKAYFGLVEGERRLLKRRILEATTLTELVSIEWANWPEYTPTTPVDLEA